MVQAKSIALKGIARTYLPHVWKTKVKVGILMTEDPRWKTSKLEISKDSRKERWRKGFQERAKFCQVFVLLL